MDFLEILLLVGILALLLLKLDYVPALLRRRSRIVLDSCALIDARILGIAKAGFVTEQLVVPQFVIAELQFLADGSDAHKRERARYGLDVVRDLQESLGDQVVIDRTMLPSLVKTDDKLIVLAKKLKARLYTTDYNLNKVAAIEKVTVLNVNELSQLLRPSLLPGEKHDIKLVQKGNSTDQAVGYFDDGTMVVVDHAARHIGKTMSIVVENMHQTMAGKMVFAKLARLPNEQPNRDKQIATPEVKKPTPPERRPRTALLAGRLRKRPGDITRQTV